MNNEITFYLAYVIYRTGDGTFIEFADLERDKEEAEKWASALHYMMIDFGYAFKTGIHSFKINVSTV